MGRRHLIFTYIIYGAIAVSFGVSFWAAVIALLLGNALFLLIGLGGVSGPRSGSPTMVASRAAFGPLGNLPAVFLGWMTILGFGVINAVVGTLALTALLGEIGIDAGDGAKAVCLAVVLVVTFSAAVWGHATVTVMERWLAGALGVGVVLLLIFVLPDAKVDFRADLAADDTFGAFLLAFFIFASGPFSYLNVPADYTRYMDPETPKRPIALWAAFGGMIPAIAMGLIGIAAATATDMTDPVAGLVSLTPGWFTVPFLAIVVGGSITNNILGLYSSGLVLQILGVPLERARTVIIDAAVITIGCGAIATTPRVDLRDVRQRLADGHLDRSVGRHLPRRHLALQRTDGGPYYYGGGVNLRALIALVAGIVAGGAFANSIEFQGPLIDVISGGDLSVVVGFVVGGGLYFALMRGRARAAVEAPVARGESGANAAGVHAGVR